jgi:hypothetical protein
VDHWWAAVADTKQYPILCRIALAALSIFHGPKVESTFSHMGAILDPHSSRMKTCSLSAIQTVKYYLKASGKSALQFFKRDECDATLTFNMRMASTRRRHELAKRRKKLEEKQQKLALEHSKLISKAHSVRRAREEAHRDRLRHRKRARQSALESLRAKRAKLSHQ